MPSSYTFSCNLALREISMQNWKKNPWNKRWQSDIWKKFVQLLTNFIKRIFSIEISNLRTYFFMKVRLSYVILDGQSIHQFWETQNVVLPSIHVLKWSKSKHMIAKLTFGASEFLLMRFCLGELLLKSELLEISTKSFKVKSFFQRKSSSVKKLRILWSVA